VGPVEGLRVLDCSTGWAGPRACGLLADYGADVIWVEPVGGDPLRVRVPSAASVFNRGKRSIILDLSDSDDLRRLEQLALSVDVIIEDWEPESGKGIGLDWDRIKAENPGLVRCSISGFGADGPHLPVKGYEAIIHALFGTMFTQAGHRDGPIFSGLPFAGIGTAYLALIGVLAALYRRHDDGVGRHVETSMLDGALAYLSTRWWDSDLIPAPIRKKGPQTAGQRLITRAFLCADDQYIGIHTGAVGAFGRLMTLVGLDERIPPLESGRDMGAMLPPDQAEILATEFPQIIASQPRPYWLEKLRDADVAGVEIMMPTESYDSPQAIHNEMVVTVLDPVLGAIEQVAPPAKFASTPAAVRAPAPLAGQDSQRVFSESAGLPWSAGLSHSADQPPDTRPLLDGVKILDCGAYYAGPYASRLLADLGANVVKLEPPQGDEIRGLNNCFYSAQAGKRSLAANLKNADMKRAIDKLLSWADVVHHNMRPGAAERLGLGIEDFHARQADGIYLHAPGWGASGPYERRQSFEPLQSGFCGVQFEVAGTFNPPLPPIGTGDPGGGLLGAVAILMGLLHRQRTGEGNGVVCAQLNVTMTHMAHAVRTESGEVLGANQLDPLQMGFSALERLYETSDGWVCVTAIDDDEITALGKILGVDILGDVRFGTFEDRRSHDYELEMLLGSAFAEIKTDEVIADLQSAGVSAVEPVPYEAMPGFYFDPDFRRNGRVAETLHPVKGNVREVAQLIRCTDAEVVPHRLAPDIGQHSDEILVELCGYSCDEIRDLRSRGIVAGPTSL
jgi:crotonobetainyl-CoA:carnitine CoA-transferase CaiB-like acyl-CoA transferase